ncbi:WAS/WASL-interacting protein family member 3-like [Belonocnema kinseyi]|uniref:WAS/WASL-interacting protein family member 3-like n=1 Tax=Belonocnema kinseyi TaxID=2817044 RepID=UPI00143DD91F|nr:WAS/WASL-interacting protein family member 3-like [Belonocnema kinseyi]
MLIGISINSSGLVPNLSDPIYKICDVKMKIFFATLLLTFTLVINLCELKANESDKNPSFPPIQPVRQIPAVRPMRPPQVPIQPPPVPPLNVPPVGLLRPVNLPAGHLVYSQNGRVLTLFADPPPRPPPPHQ